MVHEGFRTPTYITHLPTPMHPPMLLVFVRERRHIHTYIHTHVRTFNPSAAPNICTRVLTVSTVA